MPPHCDTKDGPLVKTAKKALKVGNVNLVLPWAPEAAEDEIKKAFEITLKVRKFSDEAQKLADNWFFETVVRLHRAGEGAPFTGLKPAGLDEGPVVPRAEKDIEEGKPKRVIEFLQKTIEEILTEKFSHILHTKKYDENNVKAARKYISAMLDFMLFSHHLYLNIKEGGAHKKERSGEHKH